MGDPAHFGWEVPAAAALLRDRLGPPAAGIVLGSGFAPLAEVLGVGPAVLAGEIPGCPVCTVDGHASGVAAADLPGGRMWVFLGRCHVYEGHDAARVVFPVATLAAAGASAVLLTCAAGGLLERDRPGDFALVMDHLNLTGQDPLRAIPPGTRDPAFLDLQGAYDVELADVWRSAARDAGVPLRDGVLASLPGPSYETAAEVQMLRTLGADLVSMSTVLETIAARYLGLRVSAIACIANRGAGMAGGEAISHEGVIARVAGSVAGAGVFMRAGAGSMLVGGEVGQ
jgi:purine-nucleoside phosphorylase